MKKILLSFIMVLLVLVSVDTPVNAEVEKYVDKNYNFSEVRVIYFDTIKIATNNATNVSDIKQRELEDLYLSEIKNLDLKNISIITDVNIARQIRVDLVVTANLYAFGSMSIEGIFGNFAAIRYDVYDTKSQKAVISINDRRVRTVDVYNPDPFSGGTSSPEKMYKRIISDFSTELKKVLN